MRALRTTTYLVVDIVQGAQFSLKATQQPCFMITKVLCRVRMTHIHIRR